MLQAKHVCASIFMAAGVCHACGYINGLDVQECVREVQLHGIKNKNNDSKLLKVSMHECTGLHRKESALQGCSIH